MARGAAWHGRCYLPGMSHLTNNLKTAALMGGLTALLLVASQLITGGSLPWLVGALVLACVMNVGGYFFSDKIAIAAMRAEEVGPGHDLHRIVAELCQTNGLPMPRVYVSPQPAPNAFATGRSPTHAAVCATEGLLRMLDREEVAGVMAHELAHVKHRDILIQCFATCIGAAISVLGYAFWFGGRSENSNPIGGLLILILGPLAAGLIQAAISRQREFAADREAALLLGDARPLMTALQKIHHGNAQIPTDVNPAFNALMIAEPMNLMQGIGQLFSTHPPLEARLANLQQVGGGQQPGVRFA